jgi:hypothetical protein
VIFPSGNVCGTGLEYVEGSLVLVLTTCTSNCSVKEYCVLPYLKYIVLSTNSTSVIGSGFSIYELT